jgi:hypothetical protein
VPFEQFAAGAAVAMTGALEQLLVVRRIGHRRGPNDLSSRLGEILTGFGRKCE